MKDAVAKILLVLAVFMTFIGCSSCANNSYLFGPGNLFRDKRRSFIKIEAYKNIIVTKTSTGAKSGKTSDEYELDFRSTASGVIVGHDREITLVATSAHVCTMLVGNQINHFIPDFSIRDPSWKLQERGAFILRNYKGRNYPAVILEYNIGADVCILGSKKMPQPEIRISKNGPVVGERYYNIAAPMGIWSPKMIPLFEGFYLGPFRTSYSRPVSYAFSIPAIGGSSGSPIINGEGEIVGLLHSAYRGFEHLCLTTTNKQMLLVYRGAMRRLMKDYDKYQVILDMMNN